MSTGEELSAPRRRMPVVLRSILISAGTLVLVFGVFVGIGIPLYVFPAVDEPVKADAIFVLGPPAKPRVAYAERLMEEGVADTLVLSIKAERSKWDWVDACDDEREYRTICFLADPHTTQGEARGLQELSEQYGWDHVIVVTYRSHISRARVILDRCFTGDLDMVASPKRYDLREWVNEYVYQSAAFVKAALNPDC